MLIGHRCIHCGHPDYWSVAAHNRGSVAAGKLVGGQPPASILTPYRNNCGDCVRCRRAGCRYGPAEFFARYRAGEFGVEVDDVCEPGTESTGVERTSNRIYSCACDECRALYTGPLHGQEYPMAAKPVPKPLPPRLPRPLPKPLPPPPPKPTPSTPQKYAQKGSMP